MIGRVNENLEILEVVGVLSESDEHDWTKAVLKCKWYDGDPVYDIRRINFANNKVSKGITLTENEISSLGKLLVENDFVSVEDLEENVVRIKSRLFQVPEPEDELVKIGE